MVTTTVGTTTSPWCSPGCFLLGGLSTTETPIVDTTQGVDLCTSLVTTMVVSSLVGLAVVV